MLISINSFNLHNKPVVFIPACTIPTFRMQKESNKGLSASPELSRESGVELGC